MIVLDIETGPAEAEVLQKMCPEFKAPSNYKDPDKIQANIAEQFATWRENAALDPLTGQILAIGIDCGPKDYYGLIGPEAEIVHKAFDYLGDAVQLNEPLVGFCIKRFDLPFIVKRARILGLPVPIFQTRWKGRLYWLENIMDLQDEWNLGSSDVRGQSLDQISKALGLQPKLGAGKDFAALFASDQPKALEYLKRDVEIAKSLAKRLL